jgi:hypothetical protein
LVESVTANLTVTPASSGRRAAVVSAVGEMSNPVTLNRFWPFGRALAAVEGIEIKNGESGGI